MAEKRKVVRERPIKNYIGTGKPATPSSPVMPDDQYTQGRTLGGSTDFGGANIAGGMTALQGPTFGMFDELVGGMSGAGEAITGLPNITDPSKYFGDIKKEYKSNRDFVRGMIDQYRSDYPMTSMGTELIASAPTMVLGGVAKPVASVTQKILSALLAGGAAGGAIGFGESKGDNIADIAADTLKGATTSAALGGGFSAVGQGGKGVLNMIGENLPGKFKDNFSYDAARNALAKALMRDSTGPIANVTDDAIKNLQDLGSRAAIVDAAGQNTRQLADTLTTLPGKSKNIIAEENLMRKKALGYDIRNYAQEMIGGNKDFNQVTKDIIKRQQEEAGPFFDQVKNVYVAIDEQLKSLLDRAKSQHKNINDLQIIQKTPLTDFKNLKVGDKINFTTIKQIKEGLDDAVATSIKDFKHTNKSRSLRDLKNELLNKADELSPQDEMGSIYKQARDIFGGEAETLKAIDLGRSILNEDLTKLPDIISDLSPSSLSAFKAGVLQAIKDKAGKRGGQTTLLTMIFNPDDVDRLKLALGEDDYATFANFIKNQATLKELQQVGTGSRTAEKLQNIADLSGIEEATKIAVKAKTGNILGAMSDIYKKAQMPEATRDKLIQILMKKGPEAEKELQELSKYIQKKSAADATKARVTGRASGQLTSE